MERPSAVDRIGSYVLRSRLAVGGMSEVFLAAEPRTAGDEREVVIKRMLPQLAADADARRQFEEEGRLGLRVHDDNVVRVIDVGTDDESPYLVLEYVRGSDLERLLAYLAKEGRSLGRDVALFLGAELAGGLAAVHEARDRKGTPLRIVHQDVSPSNVLLSVFGDVKLSDLGIARAHREDRFHATPIGDRVKGKLLYLSPEQVRGGAIDQRSDVFSVATVIAELFLGRPLFHGPNELATLLAIRDVEVEPLLDIELSMPAGVVDILVAALAADPDRRTRTARDLHHALDHYLPGATAPIRRELGDLVREARAHGGARDPEATPLHSSTMPPLGGPESDKRRTLEIVNHLYDFVESTAPDEHELSYAEAVERIATGLARPTDGVRVDGGPAKPISFVEELARHLPATNEKQLARGAESFSFADRGFLTAFVRYLAMRRTGVFLCERGSEKKELAIDDGHLRFVGSNIASEMLGEFLVSRRVIDRGELEMALAVLPRFDGHLGDTLIGLGLVDPVHLFREVETQIRERALDVFLWDEGIARFTTGPITRESPFPPERNAFALVDEALRRRQRKGLDPRASRRPPALRAGLVTPPPNGFANAPLDRPERLLLQRLRHPSRLVDTIGDLARDIGGDRDRAERAFTLLELLGVIAYST